MSGAQWYKGNIHTHTTESDGDEDPHKVVSWYRRHGYDFLVLSDHNHLTLLNYGGGRRRFRKPLMVPGEEVSVRLNRGDTPIHINGVGISRVVEPIDAGGVVETLQANVDAIVEAGGIASINHPNFQWAFDHREISRVEGASLLEVFNGHPAANMSWRSRQAELRSYLGRRPHCGSGYLRRCHRRLAQLSRLRSVAVESRSRMGDGAG